MQIFRINKKANIGLQELTTLLALILAFLTIYSIISGYSTKEIYMRMTLKDLSLVMDLLPSVDTDFQFIYPYADPSGNLNIDIGNVSIIYGSKRILEAYSTARYFNYDPILGTRPLTYFSLYKSGNTVHFVTLSTLQSIDCGKDTINKVPIIHIYESSSSQRSGSAPKVVPYPRMSTYFFHFSNYFKEKGITDFSGYRNTNPDITVLFTTSPPTSNEFSLVILPYYLSTDEKIMKHTTYLSCKLRNNLIGKYNVKVLSSFLIGSDNLQSFNFPKLSKIFIKIELRCPKQSPLCKDIRQIESDVVSSLINIYEKNANSN